MKTFANTLGMLTLLLTISSFKTAVQQTAQGTKNPATPYISKTADILNPAEIDPPTWPGTPRP